MRYYAYVYRITNLKENKHYYGSRTCLMKSRFSEDPLEDLRKYKTSSKSLKKILKSEPLTSFKFKIIKIFLDKNECLNFEKKILMYFNVCYNNNFYNISSMASFNDSPEWKIKNKTMNIGKGNSRSKYFLLINEKDEIVFKFEGNIRKSDNGFEFRLPENLINTHLTKLRYSSGQTRTKFLHNWCVVEIPKKLEENLYLEFIANKLKEYLSPVIHKRKKYTITKDDKNRRIQNLKDINWTKERRIEHGKKVSQSKLDKHPFRGKKFEEIYGLDKATDLKNKARERQLGRKRSPETGLKISANNFNRTKIFILNTDDKIIIGTRTFIQTTIDKKFMKFDYLINLGIKEIGIRKNFKQYNFVIRKGLR